MAKTKQEVSAEEVSEKEPSSLIDQDLKGRFEIEDELIPDRLPKKENKIWPKVMGILLCVMVLSNLIYFVVLSLMKK